jgi:putative FmdB family regulatory protein
VKTASFSCRFVGNGSFFSKPDTGIPIICIVQLEVVKMPNYDYKCSDCGHLFEVFQNMSDEVLKDCPECKGTVKRQIGTGAGIIFKGSGFYETDYKKKDNNSNNKASGAAKQGKDTQASATESKGSAGSEKSNSNTATKEKTPAS